MREDTKDVLGGMMLKKLRPILSPLIYIFSFSFLNIYYLEKEKEREGELIGSDRSGPRVNRHRRWRRGGRIWGGTQSSGIRVRDSGDFFMSLPPSLVVAVL